MNSRSVSNTWNERRAFTMGCDARSMGVRRSTSATLAPSPVRRKDGRPPQTSVVGLPERRVMGGDACSPRCPHRRRGLQVRCRRRGHARSWRAGPAREIAEMEGSLAWSRRRWGTCRGRWRGLTAHRVSWTWSWTVAGSQVTEADHGRKNVVEMHDGDWVMEKEGDCESIRQGVSKW